LDVSANRRDLPGNSAMPTVSPAHPASAAEPADSAPLAATPGDSLRDSRSPPLLDPPPARIRSLTSAELYLFWQRESFCSQWYMSDFIHEGINYNCAEQFIMAHKACLFNDTTRQQQIMTSSDPAEQKALGRAVSGFNEQLWIHERVSIAHEANLCKFGQNPNLRRALLETGNKILAEASPYDKVWGIGLPAEDPRARQPSLWKGHNILGRVLMSVRRVLTPSPPTPPFPSRPLEPTPTSPPSVRVSPTDHGIYETSDTSSQQPPRCLRTHHLPPPTPDAFPAKHFSRVLQTCPLPLAPPIPEHGPCLSSGILTVDDASFTTRARIHSGPHAAVRHTAVALLDTGSPQTFISAEAVKQLKDCGAATDLCVRHAAPRSWGGFGTSAPLTTSASIRLSIQFLRGTSPTAALAVWACIVPPGTMQHPILLGRDSWMRFERRSYTTLPHQPPGPALGELSLFHHDPDGAAAFVADDHSTNDIYHLRYTGTQAISLSTTPTLVEVNLVRQSGAPAFTGNYMVNMLPRDDFLSDTAIFVSDGQQTIPLTGHTDLEPGDLLGTSSSPLVQVPLSTIVDPSPEPPPITIKPEACGVCVILCARRNFLPVALSLFTTNDIPVAREFPPSADPPPPKTPCSQLLARLDTDQRTSFLRLWDRLPLHLRDITFNLHGAGWSPSVIDDLADVLCEFPDVFATSKTDFGSCSLMPFKITVPPDSSPVTSRPVSPPLPCFEHVLLFIYFLSGYY